ncbi:hypothetical protein PSCICE_18810 [Pseudomonas cichorii]|nr:hypothetical protein [Pseudomonas cichorii]GFM50614.1 hypothetical protein PSCICE_18810 [Pseudomonas cichorii]
MAEKDIDHDVAMANVYKNNPGDLAAMITAFIKEGASLEEWEILIRQIIAIRTTKGRNQTNDRDLDK